MEKTMYPKVKVSEQDQDDKHAKHEHKIGSLLTLKDIQFLLAIHDSTFPVKQHRDVSSSSIVSIPKNYAPSVVMPRVSISEEKKQIDDEERLSIKASSDNKQIDEEDRSASIVASLNNKHNDDDDRPNNRASSNNNKQNDDDRQNIRASAIPRPRAVLSSPDNDAVIGNKNKVKSIRTSALKNSNSIPNRHAQCRVILCNIDNESPVNTKKAKDAVDKKSDVIQKKSPAVTVKSPPRTIKTRKPSSVRM